MTYTVTHTEGEVNETIAANGMLKGLIEDLQVIQKKQEEDLEILNQNPQDEQTA